MGDVGLPVDDEALDLVEHRRVGLVGVVPVGAARDDHADRRRLRRMVRICTGEVWVRSTLRSPLLVGRQEEGVVHLPRRVAGGKLSAVKL